MEVMERAFAMERAGERVIHLEIGEPDFPPPPAAVAACVSALQGGETHYTDSRGLAELREAIALDHARRFGTAIDPERVIVTNGTSPAMLLVFSLLLEPGDEIILGRPTIPATRASCVSAGGARCWFPRIRARGTGSIPPRSAPPSRRGPGPWW